jgi:hypothetical protein
MYWVSSTGFSGSAVATAVVVAAAAVVAAGAAVPHPANKLTTRAIRVSRVNSLVHFDLYIGHPPCDFLIAYGFP